MPSQAQIVANQANALLGTGPTSETGKSKSCLNAVKTGLTGRTVLLPGDDVAAYEVHVARFMKLHEPAAENERELVQSLADTEWRLPRIPSLEMGIYALARLEFSGLFPDQDEAVRNSLVDAKTFLTYQKQLNNLSVQEGRLRRQREQDSKALSQMQQTRRRETDKRLNEVARIYIDLIEKDLEFDHDEIGFEFVRQESLADLAICKEVVV